MELKIFTPDDKFLKTIEFNFAELKTELANQMEKYKGLVYDDSEIKKAKEDRARLNKFTTAIESKRKEIKAKCLEPYNLFEDQVKDLLEVVSKPCDLIDKQIKEYEEKKKAEKLAEIKKIYNDRIGDLVLLVYFDALYKDQWLNATYSLKNIEKEIDEKLAKAREELEVINNINSIYMIQIKSVYLKTLDLGKALAEKSRLETEKKRIDDFELAKRLEQAAKEEEKKIEPIIAIEEVATKVEEPERYVDLRIFGTTDKLAQLKKFLDTQGYKYDRLEG